MITLLITSFFAGILTILTPCSLPLLPIVLSGSVQNKSKYRIFLIIASLGLSVFIFSLFIKASINALSTDIGFIRILSGIILIVLGIATIVPNVWDTISTRIGLHNNSNKLLNNVNKKGKFVSAVLTGFALGPVFSSCSPLYGYILYAILPSNTIEGILYLLSFIAGMSLFLFLIATLGQRLISKTKWITNPNSKFKKVLGVIFIIVGVLVVFNLDKRIESYLLEQSFIQNILLNKVEQDFINSLN